MKTIMIFVKMHMRIGYLLDFNEAKYNECTVYSGVSKCFEVGANDLENQAAVTIEIGCCELIVMTSVDLQSSSQQNSGCRLVLKPLCIY